jgi:RNA polymerase sigma-70 factor (ECF subfamily)
LQLATRPTLEDERELFLRIADGDELAFTDVYQSFTPSLAAFILKLTRSEVLVDEIIQETFFQVWVSRDKLPEVREPRAWVFRISANISYSHLRRLLTEKKVLKNILPEPAKDWSAAETLQVNMLLNTVQEVVNDLSPQRKRVYQLSREAGLTVPQIAEALNLSPNTVRNTLQSSLCAIRDHLLKKGYQMMVISLLLNFF